MDALVTQTEPLPAGSPSSQGGQSMAPVSLTGAQVLRIGRAEDNVIVLDHEQVSQHHARVTISTEGVAFISNLGSTNGTYVNGHPVRNARLAAGADACVGPYRFIYTGAELIRDDDSKRIRIDAVHLYSSVRSGLPLISRRKILSDDVSLSILPGTFVAVIGASGAGKTTLLNALNGQRPAASGYGARALQRPGLLPARPSV
jgi:pSer/pThr/pTyr-binding forkhead associated (FHA) protein